MSIIKKNIVYLGIVQFVQYVLPLITFPYLARILGPDGFGKLMFMTASVGYIVLFVEYGFPLTATAGVSKIRDDKQALSRYFFTVVLAKALMGGILALPFLCIVLFINKYSGNFDIILALVPSIIGCIVFPVWFYQGVERMKYITVSTLLGKALTLPLIFIFVKNPNDIWVAALLQSSSIMVSGFVALYIIYRNRWIDYESVSVKDIYLCIKDGWFVFLSTVSVNLYSTSVTVVLGLIAGNVAVGYYNGANTVVRSIIGFMAPIYQSIYPRTNYLLLNDKISGIKFIYNFMKATTIISIFIFVLVYFFSDSIIGVVAGKNFGDSVIVLKFLAIVIVLSVINNFLGVQVMLPLGYKKSFSQIVLKGGILSIFMMPPLIYLYQQVGAAISVVFTEFFIFLMLILFHRRNRIFDFHLFRNIY